MNIEHRGSVLPGGRVGVRFDAEGMSFAGLLMLMTRWQNLAGVMADLDGEAIANVYERVPMQKRPSAVRRLHAEPPTETPRTTKRVTPQAQGWAYGRTASIAEFDRGSLIVWLMANPGLAANYVVVGEFAAKCLGFALRLVRQEGDPSTPVIEAIADQPSPLMEGLIGQAAARAGSHAEKLEWFFDQADIQAIIPPGLDRKALARRVIDQAEAMRYIQ